MDPSQGTYRTGDIGYVDADGRLFVSGRADRAFKVNGHRVDPGEVEAAILSCPGVIAACVVGMVAGQAIRMGAVVVPCRGSRVGRADLFDWISRRLPDHMRPARVAFADAMPATRAGKVDYGGVLALLAA